MIVRVKENQDGKNYIEIDISTKEMENIVKGRYPISQVTISDKPFTVSVGLERETKDI